MKQEPINEKSHMLREWQRSFHRKRNEIVKKYNLIAPEEIISFFRYSNLSKKEPDFCPLYKTGETCHTGLSKGELVCYYCGCPHYDVNYVDPEQGLVGRCKINSLRGGYNKHGYWDCTHCTLPHRPLSALKLLKNEIENKR
jgi:Zn-finger protein